MKKQDSYSFTQDQLTDAEFNQFSELIYKQAGIFLRPEKKALLNARLGKRLRAGNFESFQQYFEYVRNDSTGEELVQLINSVSTNYTSFFREQDHFDFLENEVLPGFIKDEGRRNRELVLWSAASSSGEEPYSMAMVLANFFLSRPNWRFRMYATDISTKVLEQAERGVYTEDRVDKVPTHFKKAYCQRGTGKSQGYVKIKDELRRLVSFRRVNLMEPFPWKEKMDVIFCRNVMIYFNHVTQQKLVDKFFECLLPGGYLFIGHSESLTFIKHRFNQVATTVYRKDA